jgi:fatty acid desaturase
MCICLIIIAFTESVAQITGVALYLSFYSIGMGPGAWLIPSEVFATSIRAKGMSLATTLNRAVATIVASTFLTTANAMGWTEYFLMLAVVCLLLTIFLYVFLPETKGRSLEDMTLYFAEITNDRSILDAEATLRKDGDVEKPVNELSPLIAQ